MSKITEEELEQLKDQESKKSAILHDLGVLETQKHNLLHAYAVIQDEQPNIFVCGHSHILLVQFDKNINALWLNPGACGYKGFHQVKTLLRFSIDAGKVKDMEVIELGPKNKPPVA